MSEMTLEEFLKPLSKSLGRTQVPDCVPPRVDPSQGMGREELASMTEHDLTQWFMREAKALNIAVGQASFQTLCDVVIEQIQAFGATRVVYADDPLADTCKLSDAFARAGFQATRWDATHPQESIKACEGADVGITFPFAGLASTATVVQPCDQKSGRSISLLPVAHLAVVKKSTVVPHMIDVFERLDAAGGAALPSSLTCITGPSATADIELVTVVGVHGPVRCAVVLVDL